ncbi:MAG TPA: phosphatidylglycerophosphatase A [Balneolaceae bacterium]|nr:phosphatidylglycerophosphatase A [Balneolaceae bacterium]|tara:strand:+ start:227908 stop:228384 length:477 start_codon:yes stop_codon:yes gene_type:complete
MEAFKRWVGAGFGSGYSPKAPGTVGSLFALIPVYFVLQVSPVYGIIILVIITSILTLWTSSACESAWGKDPGTMVMDEFAGQSLAFVSISLTPELTTNFIILIGGFVLFRFFDILKPLGIYQVQKAGGGWGILLDDIIAGFYAFLCLKTLIFIVPNFF